MCFSKQIITIVLPLKRALAVLFCYHIAAFPANEPKEITLLVNPAKPRLTAVDAPARLGAGTLLG